MVGKGNGSIAANFTYLTGTIASSITWPSNSIPATYTICSLTRYTGGAVGVSKRILQGKTLNWLHGHSGGMRGVVQYASASSPYYVWNTLQNNIGTTNNWLVMCGKNIGGYPTNILADGASVGTASGGVGGDVLTINGATSTTYNSNFAFSQLLIWNQALNDADMLTASNMLTSYLLTGSYYSYAVTWPYPIPKPMAWYRAENWVQKWNSLPGSNPLLCKCPSSMQVH